MQYSLIAAALVGAVVAAPWEQVYETSVPPTVYGVPSSTTSCTYGAETQVAYSSSSSEEKPWGYASSSTEEKPWGYSMSSTTEEMKSYYSTSTSTEEMKASPTMTSESKMWESSTTCTEEMKETPTGWYPNTESSAKPSYYATGAWSSSASAPYYPAKSSSAQGYAAPTGYSSPAAPVYPHGTAAPSMSMPAKSSPTPAPYTGAASNVKAAGLFIGAGALAALFL